MLDFEPCRLLAFNLGAIMVGRGMRDKYFRAAAMYLAGITEGLLKILHGAANSELTGIKLFSLFEGRDGNGEAIEDSEAFLDGSVWGEVVRKRGILD